jgi:hypothetical protein
MKKLTSLFLTIVLLFALAMSITKLPEIQDVISEATGTEVEISTNLNKTRFNANEKLTAEFTFDSKIKDWYYKEDGLKVINKRENKGKISVDLLASDGEGKLEFYADFGGGYQREAVYTYSEGGIVFASGESEDIAWTEGLRLQKEYTGRHNGHIRRGREAKGRLRLRRVGKS